MLTALAAFAARRKDLHLVGVCQHRLTSNPLKSCLHMEERVGGEELVGSELGTEWAAGGRSFQDLPPPRCLILPPAVAENEFAKILPAVVDCRVHALRYHGASRFPSRPCPPARSAMPFCRPVAGPPCLDAMQDTQTEDARPSGEASHGLPIIFLRMAITTT